MFILYLVHDMGLQYLIFMGRSLENKKKLTLVRIMNNVNIFKDSVAMSSNFME